MFSGNLHPSPMKALSSYHCKHLGFENTVNWIYYLDPDAHQLWEFSNYFTSLTFTFPIGKMRLTIGS